MKIWQAFKQLSERIQMCIVFALLILLLAIIAAIVLDLQAASEITSLLVTVAAAGGYGISRGLSPRDDKPENHQKH